MEMVLAHLKWLDMTMEVDTEDGEVTSVALVEAMVAVITHTKDEEGTKEVLGEVTEVVVDIEGLGEGIEAQAGDIEGTKVATEVALEVGMEAQEGEVVVVFEIS